MEKVKPKIVKLWDDGEPEVVQEVTSIEEIPEPQPRYAYYVITPIDSDGNIVASVMSSTKNFAANKRIDKMEKEYPECQVWSEKFFSKKQAEERRDEIKQNEGKKYDYGI